VFIKKVALGKRSGCTVGTDGACPPTALLERLIVNGTECSRINTDIKLIALAITGQLE